VQPGNRAVTIQMSEQTSSVALVKPGDYVDVFAVMQQGQSDLKFAVVLLQRVLVLAAGLETSPDAVETKDKSRFTSTDSLLTLSLSITEAQLLALAQEKGKIAIALRNPEDQRTAQAIPDMSSTSLFDVKARPTTPHGQGVVPVEIKGQ
jgi:pilus assembly protein CpaB